MEWMERRSKKPIVFFSAAALAAAAAIYTLSMLADRPPAPPSPDSPSEVAAPPTSPSPKAAPPVRGSAAAAVTIEAFSDFQCPYCARSVATLKQLLEKRPQEVRWIFRHFPVFSSHPNAPALHMVALAAGEQGRFWEMHDLLFAHQDQVSRDDLLGYARRLNLDMNRFEASLRDRELMARIETDYNEAVDRGVRATPTFFINGRKVEGAIPYPLFEREVALALSAAKR